VDSTATFGRRTTLTFERPIDASTPISACRSQVPRGRTTSPRRRSSPACRTATPCGVAALIATVSEPLSVSSTRTTVSAPSGIGAPVMMRIASPGPTARPGTEPAATAPTTRRRAPACATSAPRTAYPSIAELRNGGTSRSAAASSVRTAPRASSSPTSVDSSGVIRARMRSSASSTVSVESAARAALELVGIGTSLVCVRYLGIHGKTTAST
jgi:hypothetical protein